MATHALDPPLTAAGARAGPAVGRLARLTVVVAATAPVGLYLWLAVHQLGYPYELEWMEGGAVEIVARVVAGHSMYVAPTLHYVPYPYTPLYFWTSALVAHLVGVGFLPLRLVSFAASLGCLAVLFALVRRQTGDWVAGWLAAGLFAATYQVGGAWLDVGRVDSLYLLLLLVTFAVARRAADGRDGVLVGLLAFAAFFTKQSALVAVAPVLGVLLVTRRRVGVTAVATLAVAVGASTLLLDALTQGWYRYYVFSELSHQGINAKAGRRFVPDDLLRPVTALILLGLAGIAVGLWRHRGTAWGYWGAVVAGLLVSVFVARLHAGSGRDVLIPAYAALCLIGALGYDALRRGLPGPRPLREAALAAVLVFAVVHLWGHPTHLIPSAGSERTGQRFVAAVAAEPGQVIVLDHPWYASLAGKAAWAQGEAIHDVLRAGPSAARTDLVRSIETTLTAPSITSVYVDMSSSQGVVAQILQRDFVVGPKVFACYRCFFPVTDLAVRPYLHYLRRTGRGASR
jgi:hypothetical protein